MKPFVLGKYRTFNLRMPNGDDVQVTAICESEMRKKVDDACKRYGVAEPRYPKWPNRLVEL
jgi:hypothetical protein